MLPFSSTLGKTLLCLLLPSTVFAQQAAHLPDRAVADQLMSAMMARTHAPGAIVGISRHGERTYFAYGQARNDGTPFAATTLVEIGSCTKVFTTTLFALEIERGQMQPNASVQQYMPPGKSLSAGAQAMTPLELADFTSGLPDDPPNLPRELEDRSIRHYTTEDFFRWLHGWQPSTPLPAPYAYSNAGTGLLGYLVQDAAGMPWGTLVARQITGPLGMTDTRTDPDAAQTSRMAQGHRTDGMVAPPWPYFAWFAAGALRSTAADMLSFGEANLGHAVVGNAPVPPQLTAAMERAQSPLYPLPYPNKDQAMAWVVDHGDAPGLAPEVFKNGGTAGFSTVILINRRKDLAIFIAVNQGDSNPAGYAIRMGRMLR